MPTCPKCGKEAASLVNIDAGMRLGLAQAESEYSSLNGVCQNCMADLSRQVSHGAKLRAEEVAKEQKKLMLWKSRVGLVKHARSCMQAKSLSEAALSYEKYIRILEIVFGVEKGKLTVDTFRDKAHQKELTILASVYWDLVCIYDSNTRYADRQEKAMSQLIKVAPLTPVFPDLVVKANNFVKKANNPNVFKRFLRDAGGDKRCFIATSLFGEDSSEVIFLRQFRDTYLLKNSVLRSLVALYYAVGPFIVALLDYLPSLKSPLRCLLRLIVTLLGKTLHLPIGSQF